jgi:arylsulfatase A-like enzyme
LIRELAARTVVLLAAGLLAGCAGGGRDSAAPPGERFPGPPDPAGASLLFVSLDTFRADAAGCGGNPRARTPWLDRIARGGAQMEGLAATPLTLPSHTSMLTGLDPPAHGVRDNGIFRLPPDVPTLAERLEERGVRTAAHIAAFPLERRFGLDRGFSVYDDPVSDTGANALVMAQRPGHRVVASARSAWEHDGRQLVWVHLFDAHTPHDAPRPWRAATGDEYLGDVAWADHWLGAAFRDARAAREALWVVVLGDHGESRGDHRESTHGLFVYGATMRVPAVLWPAPPGTPSVSRHPFRLVDLPATVFELLGLDPADAPGSGVSVVGDPPAAAYMESRYALYHYGWSPLAALQEGRWKYVEAPQPELYDLAVDPGETQNRIGDEPERAAQLAEALARRTEGAREASAGPLDEEARAALESLGYVTGGGEDLRTDLPDPKDMVTILRLLERAQAAISAGRPDLALNTLRQARSRDPANKDVYLTFGIAYTALGSHAEAADAFRRSLELPPHRNDRVPRFELASALFRLGKPAEAAEHLRIIVEAEPDDADAWYNLGLALRALGKGPEAVEAFQAALRADPGHELAGAALGGPPGEAE